MAKRELRKERSDGDDIEKGEKINVHVPSSYLRRKATPKFIKVKDKLGLERAVYLAEIDLPDVSNIEDKEKRCAKITKTLQPLQDAKILIGNKNISNDSLRMGEVYKVIVAKENEEEAKKLLGIEK